MPEENIVSDLSNDVLRLIARQQVDGTIVVSLLDPDETVATELGKNKAQRHSIFKDLRASFRGVTSDEWMTQITIAPQGEAQARRQAVETFLNSLLARSYDLLPSGQKRITLPYPVTTTQLFVEVEQLPDGAVEIVTRPTRLAAIDSQEANDQLAAIDTEVDRRFTRPHYDVYRGRRGRADTTTIPMPKNGVTAFQHGQQVAHCVQYALTPFLKRDPQEIPIDLSAFHTAAPPAGATPQQQDDAKAGHAGRIRSLYDRLRNSQTIGN